MEKEDKELSNASDEDFTNLDSSSDSSDGDKDDNSSDNDSDDSNQDASKKKKKKNPKKQAKKAKKVPKQKIIFNVSDTQYDVVKYVGKKVFKWKLSYEKETMDWDLFWTDCAVQPETLARMQTYQKINHFPGMYSLARKNHLGRNLMRMKKNFPEHYKFFPSTFLLPSEYADFRAQFTKKSTKTFIVKPEASCQGRGIFLTMSPDSVQVGEHYVVQRYLQKPFLIDGLKFDMRIYVLIAGCDPLKVFLYDDGLGRFATENYVAPNADNLDNLCMHLTNYAINKENPNFVFNESSSADDVGHKRSLKAVLKTLRELGHDVDKLWKEIKKIIIKTFCSVQPILAHSYRSCHPEEPYNNMCFELLGFDIMIDHKLRPWLIEVNHTPSFTTDTPLDKSIKKSAIRDALRIMNISVENNIKAKNKKRLELQQRVLTGKKVKMTPEEKKEAFEKAQQERDMWESKNCGRYEKIYPIDDPSQCEEDYEEFMKVANKAWEEWTGLSVKRNTKKVADPNKPPPMVFGNGPAVVPPPKAVQKQKTMAANQVQNPNQNARPQQSEEKGAGVEANEEAYGIEKCLDDENNAFMAHVAAITGKERYDVVHEDHEGGESERNMGKSYAPVKSYTMVMSGVHSGQERQDTKNGENEMNYRAMNSSSPSMNGISSSPESKVTSKNAAFRIKTLTTSKDRSLNEAGNGNEDNKYLLVKKFSNYLNGEKGEEMQVVGASANGKVEKEMYSKKVPLKLSNGVVGDFGAGIHQIWTGPGALAEAYAQEIERGPREASNILLNKMSGRNEYNMKAYGKKMTSPSYQHQHAKQPGNYIAPRLFELNINGGNNAKEEVPTKQQASNGTSGISLQGFGVAMKAPGKVMTVQRGSSQNVNPVHESQQAAIQRYYNYLNQYKK